MYTIEILTRDFKNNTEYLKDTLLGISDVIIEQSPAAGKWSILTILDHLRVTDTAIFTLGQSNATPTGRSAFTNINKVKTVFQNHEMQLPAPKSVLPKYDGKSKDDLISEMVETRKATLSQGESLGWNEILLDFSHPITGTMTRLEWVYFSIYHTERHICQIERIKNELLSVSNQPKALFNRFQ